MNSGAQKKRLPDLDGEINKCMIKDRYELVKQLKSGKPTNGKQKSERSARLRSQVERSQALAEQRRASLPEVEFPGELPISERTEEIGRLIRNNQVVILSGETGSGKTTQLPKLCLKLGLGVYGKIGHTQPRRVAARTVANRIAEELGVTLGKEVGYQVRFTDHTTDRTLIKVMTDGILLSETQRDRFLESYDTIIIDEAHERSLNIDFLLGYIKRILPKRPGLKVIITSATIDVERFSRHFNNAPVIEVSGRTYTVETLYRPLDETTKSRDSDELIQEAVLEAVNEIEQISHGGRRGDILVFLPGEREIRDIALTLRKASLKSYEILPLYSRLGISEQNKVFQTHSQRRIILATNVAETSITVPGIGYVIDPGVARISRYSARSKVQQLPVEKISQASAEQRKGRCGRISEGVCIRLYSEEDFESRPRFTEPEILRTNLAAVILQMLVLKLGDIARFPFVERPPDRQINDGFNLLKELEAVNSSRNVTRLGKDLAKIPLDLRLGRMILQAAKECSLSETLLIVSAHSIQDPRERPYDHRQAADEAHRQYRDEQSDFLAWINLWNGYEETRQRLTKSQLRKYCRTNFLSYPRMREWREIHRQLTLISREMNLKLNSLPADYRAIHRAILSGLLGNIGEKYQQNEYLGAQGRKHYIFPGSSQFKRQPRWIVSAELVETSRVYGRMVAEIDSDWIESLALHLIKRSYDEPWFSAKRGRVMVYERVTLYGLAIVERRPVDFGGVDSKAARQIFIQSALVERQLKSKVRFYKHNIELIEELEKVESKTRRRDLLIDGYTIHQFYDERLPAHICSQFDLETWVKENPSAHSNLMCMTREMLMRQDNFPDHWSFPDELFILQANLKLNYRFEPKKKDDGITIDVPISLLGQVPSAQLDWLVPGLLREKCLALVKSLPKTLRKNFVPVPETIDKVVDKVVYDGRSLKETLGEQLYQLKGIKIPLDSWNEASLDDHLLMNVRVLDESGQVLGEGRQLRPLVERFQKDLEPGLLSGKDPHKIERKGLVGWDFDSLPETVEFEQAGITIRGYPALLDQGDSAAIQVMDTPHKAAQCSEQGCLRLIMLQLPSQVKTVSENIPGFKDFSLLYAPRGGSRQELLTEMVEAIFRYTFIEGQPLVRTQSGFTERLEARKNLFGMATEVGELAGTILSQAHDLGLLIDKLSGNLSHARDDIGAQLDKLLEKGFPGRTPFHWLKQYPRYLKAIAVRLDKLPGHYEKDKKHTLELQSLWQKLSPYIAKDINGDEQVMKLRWMFEEYRVSLFAQSLGTKIPVSAKRLQKQLLTVESSLDK